MKRFRRKRPLPGGLFAFRIECVGPVFDPFPPFSQQSLSANCDVYRRGL
jgi:hypothetical protein